DAGLEPVVGDLKRPPAAPDRCAHNGQARRGRRNLLAWRRWNLRPQMRGHASKSVATLTESALVVVPYAVERRVGREIAAAELGGLEVFGKRAAHALQPVERMA